MSDYFPMELTRDILSRLPVKSLCRFKTVSKKLYYLIEYPDFIKYHLRRSRESGNNKLFLVEKLRGSSANPIHAADVNSIHIICHGAGIEKVATTRLVDHLIGCCDGLACLSSRKRNKITMINISTREHHTINYNYKPMNTLDTCEFPLGFGYDSINDDYKLVFIQWIDRPEARLSNYKPKIYSLKTCKWTTTIAPTTKPYLILSRINREEGVFMAASLHTFAIDRDKNLIAAFNLETLTFHAVNMPSKLSHIDVHLESPRSPSLLQDNELSVLGGLLCVAHFDFDKCCTDIWVMEEYKVKKSWSKRFSVPMQVPVQDLVPLLPLAYANGGDQILMVSDFNKYLYLFDHVKEQVSKVHTIRTRLMSAQVSTPSLVRLRQRKQNVFPKKRHLKLSHRQNYKKSKQNVKPRAQLHTFSD